MPQVRWTGQVLHLLCLPGYSSQSASRRGKFNTVLGTFNGCSICVKKDDPLDFALTNLMFDETELELNIGGVHGEAAWSVLASHGQITYCGHGEVVDIDAVRAPCILPTKKAVTMWPVLSAGPAGLWPGVTSVNAKFRAVLVTCDAGPANLKLLRHLCALLPPGVGVICTLCAQHHNGNVIERATKLLGILPGCFAIARSCGRDPGCLRLGRRSRQRLLQGLSSSKRSQKSWRRSRLVPALPSQLR